MPGGKIVIVSGRFLVSEVYFWGGMAEGLFFSCMCKIVQKSTLDMYNITSSRCHATPKINFCHLPVFTMTSIKLTSEMRKSESMQDITSINKKSHLPTKSLRRQMRKKWHVETVGPDRTASYQKNRTRKF